jgi:antirestriction protein ArdC
MVEFLVETYAPCETPSAAARHAEDVARAAALLTETGAVVRLQRAIFLPEDDIAVYLFQAPSANAVRDAMTRAGLRSDRITEAVSTEARPARFHRGTSG